MWFERSWVKNPCFFQPRKPRKYYPPEITVPAPDPKHLDEGYPTPGNSAQWLIHLVYLSYNTVLPLVMFLCIANTVPKSAHSKSMQIAMMFSSELFKLFIIVMDKQPMHTAVYSTCPTTLTTIYMTRQIIIPPFGPQPFVQHCMSLCQSGFHHTLCVYGDNKMNDSMGLLPDLCKNENTGDT